MTLIYILCCLFINMKLRSLSLAFVSGIAVFLIVGVAVTEFAQSWIEFSLFLGIPAGLASGVFTAAGVYLGLADDAPASRRRVAGAFAAFGVSFLILLVVFGWIVGLGVVIAILGSVVIALAVTVLAYLRGPKAVATIITDDGEAPSRVN